MIKFGTGGWRAIIGDEFIKTNIRLLAAALSKKMIAENVVASNFIIGYDRRFLSVESAQWIAEVMAGYGITSYLINYEAPTPVVMFTVKYYGSHYGLVVTASHNPAIYNGVKVFTHGGRDADETVTADIEKYIDAIEQDEIKSMPYDKAIAAGLVMEINPQNEYLDSIIRTINMDAIRSKKLRVVLDPMYGVSKTSLQTILLTARCDVDVIHERHDALFGGRLPTPNVDTLSTLMSYVNEKKFDIGIATDGDADRLGVVDDKAQFLHPNKILVLLYYYLLRYKGWKGAAVRNLATTHLLDAVAKSYGEKCHEVPVGFKHVSSRMAETNAIIGGESSGGLTVRGHIQGKDGIYAAALLVEMIATTGRKLSEIYKEITNEFGEFIMDEHDYRFSQETKDRILNTLMEEKKLPDFGTEVEKVSYLDGCKVYFKCGGWIVSRFSGTEPLLRIFCEMNSLDEARRICKVMEEFLEL